jgi:DNA-binding response OmpR family regulator
MNKETIVIIDDDKELLEELKEVFSVNGYEVVTLHDANTAAGIVSTIKPALILLDLKMPLKTGFQLADELRRFSELLSVPIVGMTGVFTESEHSLLMSICGIRKCFRKPFNPPELVAQIEQIILENNPRSRNK